MIFATKIKIIIIGLANIFNLTNQKNEEFKIIDYETEYVYSEKYAVGEETIIVNGEKGYSFISDGKIEDNKEPINEIIRIGTHQNNNYTGTLTGYGPDCYGCSKKGNVACSTNNKKNWSLIDDGIIYNDLEYGNINIIASDHTLFPCGTVIEITNSKYEKMLAVVLDTGGTMRSKWRKEGKVHIDLAFETEAVTASVTDKNTQYYVKRWGW